MRTSENISRGADLCCVESTFCAVVILSKSSVFGAQDGGHPKHKLAEVARVSGLRANPNVLRPAQLGLGTRAGRRRA